jgi:hypothetical protein
MRYGRFKFTVMDCICKRLYGWPVKGFTHKGSEIALLVIKFLFFFPWVLHYNQVKNACVHAGRVCVTSLAAKMLPGLEMFLLNSRVFHSVS